MALLDRLDDAADASTGWEASSRFAPFAPSRIRRWAPSRSAGFVGVRAGARLPAAVRPRLRRRGCAHGGPARAADCAPGGPGWGGVSLTCIARIQSAFPRGGRRVDGSPRRGHLVEPLTPREREILALLAWVRRIRGSPTNSSSPSTPSRSTSVTSSASWAPRTAPRPWHVGASSARSTRAGVS